MLGRFRRAFDAQFISRFGSRFGFHVTFVVTGRHPHPLSGENCRDTAYNLVPVVDVTGDGGVVDRERLEGHLHPVVRHGLPHELQLSTIEPYTAT